MAWQVLPPTGQQHEQSSAQSAQTSADLCGRGHHQQSMLLIVSDLSNKNHIRIDKVNNYSKTMNLYVQTISPQFTALNMISKQKLRWKAVLPLKIFYILPIYSQTQTALKKCCLQLLELLIFSSDFAKSTDKASQENCMWSAEISCEG